MATAISQLFLRASASAGAAAFFASSRLTGAPYGLGSMAAHHTASGLSASVVQRISERGARMERRDDRRYRQYLSEEQRSQPGCPPPERRCTNDADRPLVRG